MEETKENTSVPFKEEFTFERRQEVASKIKEKFPDRVPVIVERARNAGREVPQCSKRKFLVPAEITVSAFVFEIRKHMPELDANQTVYIFINNTLPSQTSAMTEIYGRFKDEDGFLYVTYNGENAFGSASR